LFLGDSGSQFLGFVLAALGIAYNPIGFSPLASWYVPILLVGVPIFDAALVIFSRLRRGKPVYQAALDHTYHRLVALGMSSNRAVLTMHTAALILGSLAFLALDQRPAIANGIFAAVVLAGVAGVLFLDTLKTITTQL
jgi:UDP-GlcNAc:undecaprenyl-phosphate GlcNAc-1-phosphate transferase